MGFASFMPAYDYESLWEKSHLRQHNFPLLLTVWYKLLESPVRPIAYL